MGDRIRVLRSPYLDQIGRIVNLPAERQIIATGARLRVAEVAIGEQLVLVPLANLLKLTEA